METLQEKAVRPASSNWPDIVEAAVALRRELHREPELTWHEHGTAALIRRILTEAKIAWKPCAVTGTVGMLAPNATGRHVALRADIDALPIDEASGMEWSSRRLGCMHACGHDGHTATLMAAAWWLKNHEEELPGPVSLLFQPAEEGGHGAKKMIEDGGLEGVEAIYGWHNWPALPLGKAVCPDGPVMGANGTFLIEVRGVGGHASQPEECRDPVLAACAINMALQQIVSRRLSPHVPAVVSLTSIDAPSKETVIPNVAHMAGSVRVGETERRREIFELIEETARQTAQVYGCEAGVELRPRYDATVNAPGEAARWREALTDEFGADWRAREVALPVMASEDFSYYLNAIPGAFALVGMKEEEERALLHNPEYDFNDNVLGPAARMLVSLAGGPSPSA